MTDEMLRERLNVYEALYEQNPHDGLIGVARTYLYVLAGRSQDALKSSLEASLSVTTKSVRVQMAIALGYYLRDKPGEALIESRYALNIDPAGPLCYLLHASILLELHRTDEARLAFLKCLSLASDNTFLTDLRLRNRKAVCAAQQENPLLAAYSNLKLRAPDLTEADVQQLVESNPTDPVLKALCASIQRRNGKIREALSALESDLVAYEAFPERLFLLWKIYDDQLGDHQKGEVLVRRLLEVDPLNDRARGPGYAHLDEESLRHVTFLKSLEDLPDSIYAKILPVAGLETLAGTTPSDIADMSTVTPCEERAAEALSRTFVVPGAIPQGTPSAAAVPPETVEGSDVSAPPSTSPPETPVTRHMASLLEQAQLIARDLRAPIAPAPLTHAEPDTPAGPTPVEPGEPGEPEDVEVDTLLQASENGTAEAAPPPPPLPPEQARADGSPPPACAPAAREAPETATVTLREANKLLADSRFEEALRAFLGLGGKE